MIYTFIPYSEEKPPKLWDAYNKFMELLPDNDDWACLIDHDVMFTRKNWFHQLNDIIKKHPEYDCFIARTNRIMCRWQKIGDLGNSDDIKEHKKLGEKIQQESYDEIIDVTNKSPFSGFLMLVKKRAWKKVKFIHGEKSGFGGVDNAFHQGLKVADFKIGLMMGVYLYHWHGNE